MANVAGRGVHHAQDAQWVLDRRKEQLKFIHKRHKIEVIKTHKNES